LAVVLAGCAWILTFPLTYEFVIELWNSGSAQPYQQLWTSRALAITAWNIWFIGIPIVRTVWVWIMAVWRADEDRTFLWREYWLTQLAVLMPAFTVIFSLLLYLLFASMAGFGD